MYQYKDDIKYEEDFFVNSRGSKLFTCRWTPRKSECKALIFICHGSDISLHSLPPLAMVCLRTNEPIFLPWLNFARIQSRVQHIHGRETGEQAEEEVPLRLLHGRNRGASAPQEGSSLLGRCRAACPNVQGLLYINSQQ
ncbi:alpha/beta-Hydrolases superfamily protein [Zea mays]|uniref:Alpha/beta-Hydrolases superfamily protein n=1 Tax=Zea mays TaxID=4577 RepID=A0A1D6LEV4_MAIZE|nr:alpha/beta-Hydrolases superfamily protein [Zea mays]